jgi:hypothetical protein
MANLADEDAFIDRGRLRPDTVLVLTVDRGQIADDPLVVPRTCLELPVCLLSSNAPSPTLLAEVLLLSMRPVVIQKLFDLGQAWPARRIHIKQEIEHFKQI